jgi:dTMP kinase
MTQLRFFGDPPPGISDSSLPGRLIVIEGTDGVGRSTQIALLKEWLEASGYAVLGTGLRRSSLAGRGIERAKLGHTLDPMTLNLFYATDFCDRMEHIIIPGLRAGMVVLTDRYIFSIIARAVVRGVNRRWIEDVFGFALVPDIIFYLDIDVEHLIPRVLSSTGFDYWESGQDFLRGHDVYKNFIKYQSRLLPEFHDLALQHDFRLIDARRGVLDIFADLKAGIGDVVDGMMDEAPPEIVENVDEPLSVEEIMAKPTSAAPWE